MNASVQKLDVEEKNAKCRSGELFLVGKIQEVDKFQNKSKQVRYRTRVLLKDKTDDFAYPMPVDVVSDGLLGVVGEIWEGVVRIHTFRKDYSTRPDEDGVVKKIKQLTLECYYG